MSYLQYSRVNNIKKTVAQENYANFVHVRLKSCCKDRHTLSIICYAGFFLNLTLEENDFH
jgi:hypothetical protein